jgi:hypothetical protein
LPLGGGGEEYATPWTGGKGRPLPGEDGVPGALPRLQREDQLAVKLKGSEKMAVRFHACSAEAGRGAWWSAETTTSASHWRRRVPPAIGGGVHYSGEGRVSEAARGRDGGVK